MMTFAAIGVAVASIVFVAMIYLALKSDMAVKDELLKKEEARVDALTLRLNKMQEELGNQNSQISQLGSGLHDQEARIVVIDQESTRLGHEVDSLNQTLNSLYLNTVEYSSNIVSLSPGQQNIAKARCNPGEIPTGGGFDTSDASVIAVHNGVSADDGWDVIAKNTGDSGQDFIAFAVCASPIR